MTHRGGRAIVRPFAGAIRPTPTNREATMNNSDERDYAEESANRALLREGDVGPFGPIDRAAILRGRAVDSLLDSGATAEPIAIDCGRVAGQVEHAAHAWASGGAVVLGRYHCQGYGAAQLDDAAPAGDPVGQVATADAGALSLDWTAAEADIELADGMAHLAQENLGAPWAVVVAALDRTTRRGFVDRGAFEAELRLLIRQAGDHGISNG